MIVRFFKEETMEKRAELLSPAGSFEGMKAVIAAGADAVYIGGRKFGARAYAANPENDTLLEAIDYAHLRKVRVYLTVNTLLKEEEIKDLIPFITPCCRHGLDGILVQDFGVLSILHEHFPELPLHASTQMTVTGPYTACMLKELGVTRIVPARELSLPELKKIHDDSGLEVEAFVHGALCFCYSGQCLLSSMLGGRSGNRGRCAQPCRLPYSLEGRTGSWLSPKDLCALEQIPELIGAGVISLKIEGRMKQPEYAAGVTSVYRKYLDLYEKDPAHFRVCQTDLQLLSDLYNREGFTDGYFHRHSGPEMMAVNLNGDEAKTPRGVRSIYDDMHRLYVEKEKQLPASGKCILKSGRNISISVSSGDFQAEAVGDPAEEARKQPLTKERIREQLLKTGGSDFYFSRMEVDTDEKSFVPVSLLNQLRREALENLRSSILAVYGKTETGKESPEAADPEDEISVSEKTEPKKPGRGFVMSASFETEDQYRVLLETRGIRDLYTEGSIISDIRKKTEECRGHGKNLFLALPFIERTGDCNEIYSRARELLDSGLSGFLARSLESYSHLKALGLLKYSAIDSGIYTWNHASSDFFRRSGILFDTAPLEFNKKELYGRENAKSEIIVYGRAPLMVTAQCFRKNVSGCTKVPGFLSLTDRKGTDFLIKNCCDICYNVLYNSVPSNLSEESLTLLKMGFRRARLAFTDESAEECGRIASSFAGSFAHGEERKPEGRHTKGHFERGVL